MIPLAHVGVRRAHRARPRPDPSLQTCDMVMDDPLSPVQLSVPHPHCVLMIPFSSTTARTPHPLSAYFKLAVRRICWQAVAVRRLPVQPTAVQLAQESKCYGNSIRKFVENRPTQLSHKTAQHDGEATTTFDKVWRVCHVYDIFIHVLTKTQVNSETL